MKRQTFGSVTLQSGAGKGYAGDNCAQNNQIAATALVSLGLDWQAFDPQAGAPLQVFLER